MRTVVADLSVAQQQLVEIARALSCRARILVLDEPTSALSEAETESLFATLRQLRAQGVGIIYISHRLEEILRLADRITVLRDGRSIGTQQTAEVNQRELVRWMVGRDVADHLAGRHDPGEVALEVRGLRNRHVDDVSFDLRYGEILGHGGLGGFRANGVGPRHLWHRSLGGRPDPTRRPQPSHPLARDAVRAGIVLVPEDRKRQGLVMGQSLAFNVAIPWLADWISWAMPSAARRRAIVDRAVQGFAIKLADLEQSIDSLSGGNQQKALVGRWMEHRPKVLILDEPTRGVDVGARAEMFAILGRLVESGMAVLLILFRIFRRCWAYRTASPCIATAGSWTFARPARSRPNKSWKT